MKILRTNPLASFLKRFRSGEDGGPTVEFVLVFLPFIMLPVVGFELGLLMTRHAMLERGVDMAVRELRLTSSDEVGYVALRNMICAAAGILPDCTNSVRLEMQRIDMYANSAFGAINPEASCAVQDEPFSVEEEVFHDTIPNEVMVVRVCGAFEPILPTFGLGKLLSSSPDNKYRLVSTTAFVMEPI